MQQSSTQTLQYAMSTAGAIPFPTSYNIGLSAQSTAAAAAASFMDIASFPMMYTCSPIHHHHHHHHQQQHHEHHHQQQQQQQNNRNNNNRQHVVQQSNNHAAALLVVDSVDVHQQQQQQQHRSADSACYRVGGGGVAADHDHRHYSHYNHLSVSCSSANSSNSATDETTSSVASRSPDLPTPTMSPTLQSPPQPSECNRLFGAHRQQQQHSSYCSPMIECTSAAAITSSNVTTATSASAGSMNPYVRPIRPFTIEAILGLESRAPCSVNLSLDVIVAAAAAAAARSPEQRSRNSGTGTKRKHVGRNVQRKSVASSGKEFAFRSADDKTSSSSVRSSNKCKRVRTIFTPEQLEKLENEFERQQYMVGPERLYLAASLNLTEAQVKVWFQNRRIKWRKNHLELQQAKLATIHNDEEREANELDDDDDDDGDLDEDEDDEQDVDDEESDVPM